MRKINQNPTKESLRLVEGETYTLIFVERPEGEKKRVRIKKRMRLIKCYRNHAVFENTRGIRQSFRYWDIEKLLLGESR